MICDWFVNVGLLLDFIGAFLLGFIVKYVILPGKNLERISSKMSEPLLVIDPIAVSLHSSPQLEPEEEKKVPKKFHTSWSCLVSNSLWILSSDCRKSSQVHSMYLGTFGF